MEIQTGNAIDRKLENGKENEDDDDQSDSHVSGCGGQNKSGCGGRILCRGDELKNTASSSLKENRSVREDDSSLRPYEYLLGSQEDYERSAFQKELRRDISVH